MKMLLLLFISTHILFGMVNINTASLNKLTTLEGIDREIAQRIIKHREKKCFRTVKELTKVECICKCTLKKNKGNISATGCNHTKKKKKKKKKKHSKKHKKSKQTDEN